MHYSYWCYNLPSVFVFHSKKIITCVLITAWSRFDCFITGISTAALRIFQLITSKPLQSRLQNAKHSILCSLPSLEMQTTAKTVAKDTVAGHNPILYCSISILSISAVYKNSVARCQIRWTCKCICLLPMWRHFFVSKGSRFVPRDRNEFVWWNCEQYTSHEYASFANTGHSFRFIMRSISKH